MPKRVEPPSDPGMILTAEEMRIIRYMSIMAESYGADDRTAMFKAFECLRVLKERGLVAALDQAPRAVFEVGSEDGEDYTIVSELLPDQTFKVWRRRGDELLPEHLR